MNINPISAMPAAHFMGKNKKVSKMSAPNNSINSTLMAVPLATLLAMSPIDTPAETKTYQPTATTLPAPIDFLTKKDKAAHLVKTEKYIGNDGVVRKLYYVGDKENSKNVKDIYINDGDLDGKRITEYKNITLKLIGDDGVADKEYSFPQLTVESTDENGGKSGYTERKISANLAQFLLSKENKTNISTKNITHRVNACQYGLKDAAVQTSNNFWGGKNTKVNGQKVASGRKKIGKDIYTVTAYTTNQNKKDYEILTLKRNDGAELRVVGLKNVTSTLIDAGGKIGDFKYNQISLIKGNNREVSRVFNDELFEALKQLTEDPNNKAFKLDKVHETQIVDQKGCIYDVE